MRRSWNASPRAALSPAVCALCVLLVISFILFEVLDVDGSAFASPVRAARASTITDPPEELRRPPVPATSASLILSPVDAHAEARVLAGIDDGRSDTRPRHSLRHSARTTLARGLLPDSVRTA